MSIVKKPEFIRAKIVDEPYVRTKLETYWGTKTIHYTLGTPEDDWNHIDIKQIDTSNPNNIVFYDVKRNSKQDRNSKNFLFTFINPVGKLFEYKQNGYFAYIDDISGDIIVLSHMKMQEYVNKYVHNKSKYENKSEYILIPKIDMRNDAYCVLKGTPTNAAYLQANADYNNFINFFN